MKNLPDSVLNEIAIHKAHERIAAVKAGKHELASKLASEIYAIERDIEPPLTPEELRGF